MKIILASGSPRRKELLTNMGLSFEIEVSNCEEIVTKKVPEEIVTELSDLKASEVAQRIINTGKYDDFLCIGADTLVFLKDKRLGKPKDEADAFNMIKSLSNNTHHVITGVTVIRVNGDSYDKFSFSEKTEVNVSELSDEEITEYVKTKEPMDKAGGYAIQGLFAKYIDSICGDYSNVVGLPVPKLYRELKSRNWLD